MFSFGGVIMPRTSDAFVAMCDTLAETTGIAYKDASEILMDSSVVTIENFEDWLKDIELIVKYMKAGG